MDEEKGIELIKDALVKKALGYEINESVEEYSLDDAGRETLTKKKISKKYCPPDMSALKLLIEKFYPEVDIDLSNMSDEDLYKEREKILNILNENQ